MPLRNCVLMALSGAVLTLPMLAQRTSLKAGYNIFTLEQDVELGRLLSKEIEAQVEILRNPTAGNYLDSLSRRLASMAPTPGPFRFQCRIVNDTSINAIGLPGGFLYVNRGTIEAAAGEAQFASVIAHEIAHIVLRHGTHQISKAYALQVPVSALSAAGRTTITDVLAKINGGFTASMILKNPVEVETQADLMGIQILYDAGYDPRGAIQFFEKLSDETDRDARHLSGHPDPANRISSVAKEIERLGGAPPRAVLDSPDYRNLKLLVAGLP